jgi:CRP-like cAMP-binding protein
MKKYKYTKAKQILWQTFSRNDKKSSEQLKLDYLRHSRLFDQLEMGEVRRLMEELYIRKYDIGEYLFRMGQPGAVLFIITEGEVAVELPADDVNGEATRLAVLSPGSFLGELALLDESPRSASAIALKNVDALALSRSDLEILSRREPAIGCKIYKALATIVGERLKSTNQLLNFEQAVSEKNAS